MLTIFPNFYWTKQISEHSRKIPNNFKPWGALWEFVIQPLEGVHFQLMSNIAKQTCVRYRTTTHCRDKPQCSWMDLWCFMKGFSFMYFYFCCCEIMETWAWSNCCWANRCTTYSLHFCGLKLLSDGGFVEISHCSSIITRDVLIVWSCCLFWSSLCDYDWCLNSHRYWNWSYFMFG